jgi:hypothetical protein
MLYLILGACITIHSTIKTLTFEKGPNPNTYVADLGHIQSTEYHLHQTIGGGPYGEDADDLLP